MNIIQSDQQSLSSRILELLSSGEQRSFQLIQTLATEFQQKQGFFYPILHQMEEAGLLKSKWKLVKTGIRRKFYSLSRTKNRGINSLHSFLASFLFSSFLGQNLIRIESLCIIVHIHRTNRYEKDF